MSQSMQDGLGSDTLVDTFRLDLENAVVVVLDHIDGELRQHLPKLGKFQESEWKEECKTKWYIETEAKIIHSKQLSLTHTHTRKSKQHGKTHTYTHKN